MKRNEDCITQLFICIILYIVQRFLVFVRNTLNSLE